VDDLPRDPNRRRFRPFRWRPAHPWITAAAVLAAVLLLAEAGVRAIEPRLPVVRAGDEAEMVLKAKRIQELGSASPAIDVVFFGTSMMDSAIDPEEFQRNASRMGSVYNASVVGAPVATQVRWAREIVLDQLDPATIVIGVHPIDLLLVDVFNLNIKAGQSDVIFATVERELRAGVAGDLDRWTHENLALVRQRGALRRPKVVADAAWNTVRSNPVEKFIPKRDEAFWAAHLSPLGESSLFAGDEFNITSVADQLKQNLTRDGFYVNDLYELLQVGAPEGATTVLIVPPVPIDAWVQVGVDLQVLRQGQDLIAAIAAEKGITVIDFTDRNYPNELFADIVHLNDKGATRFSRELALALNDLD
jgi:hypothetical protein